MEYKIDGIIQFSPVTKLRLLSAVDFGSPSEAHISLKSESDDNLSVSITLEADSEIDARELAEIELSRISDTLSFFHNIPAVKSQITGIEYQRVTPDGKNIVVGEVAVGIDTILSIVKVLDEKSLKKLSSDLEREYTPESKELIFWWREATSGENRILKYILLYRVMEFLFQSKTKKITAWIVNEEPSVQMFHDRKRGDSTIYTHLRDHIHPKQRTFPVKEIYDNLPKLQKLVQRAIKEKIGI